MAVRDGGQCFAQVGVGIDGVQLAGFNERGHARPGASALIVTCEQRILTIEGYGSDGVFDRVGVHFDAAICQEDLQPVPVAVDVAELLAEAGLGGDAAALMGQPETEVGDQRGGLRLACGKTFFGRTTSDAGFDLVDLGDAAQAFGGNLGAVLLIDVVQLAPGMRPAIGELQRRATHALWFGQCVIAGISVNLQDAVEAGQNVHRMAAVAPGGIGEDDGGRIGTTPAAIIAGQRPEYPSWSCPP